jgi:protein-S-isoprenylcysteine O-methyltransferase Ste14
MYSPVLTDAQNGIVFCAVSAVLLYLSRNALRNPRAHGFYRFIAWELMLVLVLRNLPVWGRDPFAPHQLASWLLIAASIGLAVHGVRLLRSIGRPAADARVDPELFGFERTSSLVTTGVFRYIRHPMYAALLFLDWGAYLKDPMSPVGAVLAIGASVALLLTALRDEAECVAHFGPAYSDYMRTSKRFVPFVF